MLAGMPSTAPCLIVMLVAGAFLAGCAHQREASARPVDVPAAFSAVPPGAVAAEAAPQTPAHEWLEGFKSPELSRLIELARKNNHDLAGAAARVRQADEPGELRGGGAGAAEGAAD